MELFQFLEILVAAWQCSPQGQACSPLRIVKAFYTIKFSQWHFSSPHHTGERADWPGRSPRWEDTRPGVLPGRTQRKAECYRGDAAAGEKAPLWRGTLYTVWKKPVQETCACLFCWPKSTSISTYNPVLSLVFAFLWFKVLLPSKWVCHVGDILSVMLNSDSGFQETARDYCQGSGNC